VHALDGLRSIDARASLAQIAPLPSPMSRERLELAARLAAQTHRAAAGSIHRAADNHLRLGWRGEGGVQDRARPAAIIVLIAITFFCNGVGAVPPESLRQAVMNAQLLLRADSR
jgi:hypothetical protein